MKTLGKSISTQIGRAGSLPIPPCPQERREACTSIFGERTPQVVSDTVQTPQSGGSCEVDRPWVFPGLLDVEINPTLSSPIDKQSPSQTVVGGSELPNTRDMGRNPPNAVSAGYLDAGKALSPTSSLSPPRHTRPLYHSIELPELYDEEPVFQPQEVMLSPAGPPVLAVYPSPTVGKDRLSPWANEAPVLELHLQTNALGLYTDTPHLHDVVLRALFDPSFALHTLDLSIARYLWDHTASFDLRRVSILFLESGTTVNVEPSMRNKGTVRVGDVLRALQTVSAGSDARNGTTASVIVKGYY